MSDSFWAGFFVAIPAIFAALLAYRKSELASAKAEIALTAASICRYRFGVADPAAVSKEFQVLKPPLTIAEVTAEVERVLNTPYRHVTPEEVVDH
jgi:hypothetical protein